MQAIDIWNEEIKQTLYKRDIVKLANYDLPEPQLRLLLRQYKQETPYPIFGDFCFYLENRFAADDVPDPLSCSAFLSGNKALIKLAEEYETLKGAWQPNIDTDIRMAQIINTLSEVFA